MDETTKEGNNVTIEEFKKEILEQQKEVISENLVGIDMIKSFYINARTVPAYYTGVTGSVIHTNEYCTGVTGSVYHKFEYYLRDAGEMVYVKGEW